MTKTNILWKDPGLAMIYIVLDKITDLVPARYRSDIIECKDLLVEIDSQRQSVNTNVRGNMVT